jgi:hypothetical protein
LLKVEIQAYVCAIELYGRVIIVAVRERKKSESCCIISGKEHHPTRHRRSKDRRILQLEMESFLDML